MKTASPNLVVGLSCFSPAALSVQSVIDLFYSPLASTDSDNRGNSTPHTEENHAGGESRSPGESHSQNPLQLLIRTIESCFADAGLADIPKNSAIFLVMEEAQGFPYSLASEINEYYLARGLDLTVMLSSHTEPSLQEALNWLHRGESELALVAAIDRLNDSRYPYGSVAVAAVLVSRPNTASALNITAYAGVQQESWLSTDPGSVSLLEVFNDRWFQNLDACKSWESLRNTPQEAATQLKPTDAKLQAWTHHDRVCFVSSLAAELSAGAEKITPLMALICTSLAQHLRVIPASGTTDLPLQLNDPQISVQSKSSRPWIHPISPIEDAHPRRAFVDLNSFGLLVVEHGSDLEEHFFSAVHRQSTELFVLSADSIDELKNNLHSLQNNLQLQIPFHELAFHCNCSKNAEPGKLRLAIVAVNRNELERLLNEALTHLNSNPSVAILPPTTRAAGIYYSGETDKPAKNASANSALAKPGKMAFILPGLGAAYPQMLLDLCFYFPVVRQVFDFVERLALRAGDKIVPSRAVFPVAGNKIYGSSQAMLATMDSAVITLLLAEWAIFALLKKLEISPDVLLGCSTGEFAAMTMGEAINILKAAETFYQLSTHVSRSVSLSELSKLRTVRVSASFEQDIEPLLKQIKEPVYLGADLGPGCALLSGEKNAIEKLCKLLKEKNLDFLILPVAIPYHTPLVAGKVNHRDEDVQKLEMGAARIESWSCSTGKRLPDDSEQLRKISTELFEKPIQLNSTIKKLHDSGVRIFVELGPKGGLVPYLGEILQGREHLAIAANAQNKPGIDQLNAMLAILTCHGIKMNLRALYERRISTKSAAINNLSQAKQLNLELRFEQSNVPAVDPDLQDTDCLQLSDSIYDYMQWSQSLGDPQDLGFLAGEFSTASTVSDEVMINYLSTMQEMHSSLLDSQEMMMLAYLQSLESEYPELSDITDTGLAFLQKPALRDLGDCFRIDFSLSTKEHLFLLDHAIGGQTSELSEQSKVYLLPLMVALEIMAEAASLLYPNLQVRRLLDIRAYRRIRVSKQALPLFLEMRANQENIVDVSICIQEREQNEKTVLAASKVEMASQLSGCPERLALSFNEERTTKFPDQESLYGASAMFHGKRMQSVETIDRVAKRCISGTLRCRPTDAWFKNEKQGRMLINPLLLDNASQFVLYQMYEHDFPLTALLPFHIESMEFFTGYHECENQTLCANAVLRSMSLRGTEASLELLDPEGRVLAHVNEISSRAIALPELLRNFIANPGTKLCQEISFAELKSACITTINKQEIPEDETTLDWLTDYLLSDSEQQDWRRVGKTDKRRYDWLSGRIATKDAVRTLLERELGIEVKPADVCIENTESGAARVYIKGLDLPWLPQISISHSRTMAAAIAEYPNSMRNAGIDIEEIVEREEGFAKLAFTEKEFAWISEASPADRAGRIASLWTAKEAAAKAHGSGFGSHLKHFELKKVEKDELFYISAKLEGMNHAKLYKCPVKKISAKNTVLALVSELTDSI